MSANLHSRPAAIGLILVLVCWTYGSPALAQNVDTTTPKHPATSFDERLFLSINHWGRTSPGLDGPMEFMSNSLTYTMIGVPVGLYVGGVASKDREMAIAGSGVLISELVAGIVTQGVKSTVQRPRPYHVLEDVRTPGDGASGFSFPSGHSSTSWALATSLMIHYPKWYVIAPSAAYATIVALSRPYLGVHYPSDLLVGALIGVGSAFLGREIERQLVRSVPGIYPKESTTTTATRKSGDIPIAISFSIPLASFRQPERSFAP